MGVRRKLAAQLGVVVLLTALGAPSSAHAAVVLQVPTDYPTIGAALAAAIPGHTVLVSPGTYLENVTVPAGVTLESTDGPDVTTIDGHRSGPDVVIQMSATVRGFTLQGGGTTYGDVGGAEVYGTLDGNVLTDNGGCYHADAVWLLGGTASNNTFHNNRTWCSSTPVISGAGTITGNDFDENLSVPVIMLNNDSPTIDGNVFRGTDPAIEMFNRSHPLIRNNLFLVSGSQRVGGAINWLVPSGDEGPTVVNNTFVMLPGASGSLVAAGGYDSATVFANNVLVGPAGAPLLDCQSGYDDLPPDLQGNDAWTPAGPGFSGLCADATGTNSNVGVDPVFVSSATGDYHLRADSPLIDAGVNGLAMAPDIDGDVRPFDGNEDGTATVDIGFDESTDPLAVVPGDVEFGGVPLARASQTSVTLTNLGSTSLSIDTVGLTGPGASDYATAGENCSGSTLPVGASCTIAVVFTPTVVAERDATLAIDGPGAVSTRTVPLTGNGLDPITLDPPSFQFSDVTVGDPGTPGSVTVTNSGGAPVTISGITLSGTTTDVTLGSETCTGAPLPEDGSCTIQFTWRPTGIGDRAAAIVLSGPAPVGTRSIPLTGHAWAPTSSVAWGTTHKAGPAYTWNGGSALARTVQSGKQRLHLAYATDRINGQWVTDSGPKAGVYYIRSTSGAKWSTPYRVNPTTQHATMLGLAAARSKVYVVWVSQTRYVHFRPTAHRVLYIRVNTNHGSRSAWRTKIRLSSAKGRVDYPVVAASGNDVHIAYTNAVTGTVYVKSSRDGGRHWSRVALGSTSISFATGRTGFPTIDVRGSTVAACWLSDMAGTIKCRVSTNRGLSWGASTIVGSQSTGYFSVAVRGSRIAVAWPTTSGIVVRQRLSGVWQPAVVVPPVYESGPYGVNVTLQGSTRIRTTWAEGEQGDDSSYVFAAESTDGGSLWFSPERIGDFAHVHWQNDWPSVIWPAAGSRYVVWNGWTANINTYRLYLRRGVGTLVEPLVASMPWVPGPTTSSVVSPQGVLSAGIKRTPSS